METFGVHQSDRNQMNSDSRICRPTTHRISETKVCVGRTSIRDFAVMPHNTIAIELCMRLTRYLCSGALVMSEGTATDTWFGFPSSPETLADQK